MNYWFFPKFLDVKNSFQCVTYMASICFLQLVNLQRKNVVVFFSTQNHFLLTPGPVSLHIVKFGKSGLLLLASWNYGWMCAPVSHQVFFEFRVLKVWVLYKICLIYEVFYVTCSNNVVFNGSNLSHCLLRKEFLLGYFDIPHKMQILLLNLNKI